MKESTKHKIKVIARFRPLIKREQKTNAQSVWNIDEELSSVKADKNAAKKFSKRTSTAAATTFVFDQVHDETSNTLEVYDSSIKKIVDNFCNGYNGTILAYGQTASGKTYTMSGAKNNGIINMAIQQVFDYINNFKNRRFLLRVSYMEIYKEAFRDLLTGTSPDTLYTDDNDNVMVRDMSELDIQDIESLQKALNEGANRRMTGRTDMNEHSSRSHTIFRIILESVDDTDEILISHLNMVDLAGSERISDTGASGVTLKEAAMINKSLSTLTLVINQITENASFVNYRDSKLTHLLKSSLGGNAQTCMLICCTPADYTQTLQTLQFGSRAKTIENTCKQNTEISDGARIKQLEKELKELRVAAEAQKDELVQKDDIDAQRLKNIEKFLFNNDKENKVVKKGGIRRQTLGGLKAGDDVRTEHSVQESLQIFRKLAESNSKAKDGEASQESTQDQTNMSMGIFNEEEHQLGLLQDEVDEKQEEIEKLTGMLDDFKNTVRNQKITIQNLTDREKNSMNESTAEELMVSCEVEMKKCDSLKSEIDKMASERSEIEVYSRSLQTTITELETEKAKVSYEFKTYRESIEERSFVVHEYKFDTEELRAELQADFKKQTNVMQTDLVKMQLELAERIKDLKEEKDRTLEYQAKFEKAEMVKSSLKATAEMESETNMKLRGKLEKYMRSQVEQTSTTDDIEDLNAEIFELQSRKSQLEVDKSDLQNDKIKLLKEIVEKKQNYSEILVELDTVKAQSESSKMEVMAQMKNDMEVQRTEMVEELEIVESDKTLLYQKLIAANKSREDLEERIRSLDECGKANQECHSLAIREKVELEIELGKCQVRLVDETKKLVELRIELSGFEENSGAGDLHLSELKTTVNDLKYQINKLSQDNSNLDTKIRALTDENEVLKVENVNLSDQKQNLDAEKREFVEKLAIFQETVDTLKTKIESAELELAENKLKSADFDAKFTALDQSYKTDLNSLEDQLAEKISALAVKTAELHNLTEEYDSTENKLGCLQQHADWLTKELEDSILKINSLEESEVKHLTELEKLCKISEDFEAQSTKIDQYRHEILEKDSAINETSNTISDMKGKIVKLGVEHEKIASTNLILETSKSELETQVNSLQNLNNMLKNSASELGHQHETVSEKLASKTLELENLKSTFEDTKNSADEKLQKLVSEQSDRINALEAKVDEKEQLSDILRKNISNMESERMTLEQDKSDAQERLLVLEVETGMEQESLKSQIFENKEENLGMKQQLEELNGKISELTDENKDYRQEVTKKASDNEEKIKQITEQNEIIAKNSVQLTEKNKELTDQISTITNQNCKISEHDEKITELTQENEKLKIDYSETVKNSSETNEMRAEIGSLKIELDDKRSDIVNQQKHFKQKYEETLKQYDEQFDDDKTAYEKIIDRLKTEKSVLSSNFETINAENSNLKEKLSNDTSGADEFIKKLTNQLETLQTEKSVTSENIKNLEFSITNLKTVVDKKEKQKSEYLEKIEEIQMELETAENYNKSSEAKLAGQYVNQISALQKRANTAENELQDVRSDRESLQARLNDLEKNEYDSNQNDVMVERLRMEVNKLKSDKAELEDGEKTQFERLTKSNSAKSKVEEKLLQAEENNQKLTSKIKSNNTKFKKICQDLSTEKQEAVHKKQKMSREMESMREKLQKYYVQVKGQLPNEEDVRREIEVEKREKAKRRQLRSQANQENSGNNTTDTAELVARMHTTEIAETQNSETQNSETQNTEHSGTVKESIEESEYNSQMMVMPETQETQSKVEEIEIDTENNGPTRNTRKSLRRSQRKENVDDLERTVIPKQKSSQSRGRPVLKESQMENVEGSQKQGSQKRVTRSSSRTRNESGSSELKEKLKSQEKVKSQGNDGKGKAETADECKQQ